MRRKRKVKTVNKTALKLFELIQQTECWAQLNIFLNLDGIEIKDEILIILISFLTMDEFDHRLDQFIKIQKSNFSMENFINLKTNTLNIITEICEDKDIEISKPIVDSLIQKIIFSNKRQFKTFDNDDNKKLKNIKERLFRALAIKDPIQTKISYERYISFKQYQI